MMSNGEIVATWWMKATAYGRTLKAFVNVVIFSYYLSGSFIVTA
jgi:hypothetical protein